MHTPLPFPHKFKINQGRELGQVNKHESNLCKVCAERYLARPPLRANVTPGGLDRAPAVTLSRTSASARKFKTVHYPRRYVVTHQCLAGPLVFL